MLRSVGLIAVLILWLSIQNVAAAETWRTPDGALSVIVPDVIQFKKLPSPPAPLLVVWATEDDSIRLTAMTIPVPTNARLIQSHVEDGLSKEVGTTVRRLPTRTIADHEIWDMWCKLPSGGFVRQAVIPGEATAYKLMALASEDNTDNQELIDAFINSVTLNPAAFPVRSGPPRDPIEDIGVNEVSGKIGAYGVFLLIGIFIYKKFVAKSPNQK
jgi:hypothetical protein